MRSLLLKLTGLALVLVLASVAVLWLLSLANGGVTPAFLLPATFTRVALPAGTALAVVPDTTLPASYTPAPSAAAQTQAAGGLSAARPSATSSGAGLSGLNDLRGTPTATARPTSVPSVTPGISATPSIIVQVEPTRTGGPMNATATATNGPAPPASRTPTVTPSRPAPPPPPDNRSPKKGLAYIYPWPHPNDHIPFEISWYYDWMLFPGNVNDPNVEFVPLIPCGDTPASVVSVLGAGYSGYLLFANEPDRPDQCPATPTQNAQFYLDLRAALPNAKFVGPQVSHAGYNGSYTGYTEEWREEVRRLSGSYPDVSGYGLHIYNDIVGAQDRVAAFCNKLTQWGELGSKELWVTEFGYGNFWGDPDFVQWQIVQMVNLFENGIGNCEVARYAYYTNRTTPAGPQPTPTIPAPNPNRPFWDLYWRNSYELSYTGQAYASVP